MPHVQQGCLLTCGLLVLGAVGHCRGQAWSAITGIPNDPGLTIPCNTSVDCELAVSPTRVLVATNCKLARFDLNGAKQEERFVNGAFRADDPAVQDEYIRDQRCHYDPLSEKFWICAARVHADPGIYNYKRLALARSRTSQPTLDPADWMFFEWDLSGPLQGFVDRPSLAMDANYIYAAIRDVAPGPFEDTRTVVFIKSKGDLLACNQWPCVLSNPVFLDLDRAVNPEGDDTYAHEFAVKYSFDANPQYLVTTVSPAITPLEQTRQTHLILGAIVPQAGGTWRYQWTLVDVPDFFGTGSLHAKPPGSGDILSTGSIFWSAVYRNGSVWAVHHVYKVDGSGAPIPRAVVRFYEFYMNNYPTGTPQLIQMGEIDAQTLHPTLAQEAYHPSTAVGYYGHVAVTWTESGNQPGQFTRMYRGLRRATDPPGVLSDIQLVQPSPGNIVPPARLSADFTGTDADHNWPCRFWGHSPLAHANGDRWESWLARYEFQYCDIPEADYDMDRDVDAWDAPEFNSHFMAGSNRADLTLDRALDGRDLAEFRRQFTGPR